MKDRKAINLIDKINKIDNKMSSFVDQWDSKIFKEKNKKKRKKIDSQYSKKFSSLEEKSEAAYASYYNHCISKYTKSSIDKAVLQTRNFVSQEALRLFKKKRK